jgi:DNA-binding transcriptional MerR regulator
MRKKGYKLFTKESYNSKRDAVLALKGHMSISQISKILEVSVSSVDAMKKYDWEQYLDFREEKNRVAKINAAKREATMVNVFDIVNNLEDTTEPSKAPDQTEIVAQRLTAIENTLEDIKDIVSKRKFF